MEMSLTVAGWECVCMLLEGPVLEAARGCVELKAETKPEGAVPAQMGGFLAQDRGLLPRDPMPLGLLGWEGAVDPGQAWMAAWGGGFF